MTSSSTHLGNLDATYQYEHHRWDRIGHHSRWGKHQSINQQPSTFYATSAYPRQATVVRNDSTLRWCATLSRNVGTQPGHVSKLCDASRQVGSERTGPAEEDGLPPASTSLRVSPAHSTPTSWMYSNGVISALFLLSGSAPCASSTAAVASIEQRWSGLHPFTSYAFGSACGGPPLAALAGRNENGQCACLGSYEHAPCVSGLGTVREETNKLQVESGGHLKTTRVSVGSLTSHRPLL
jgi:hypothetical protein